MKNYPTIISPPLPPAANPSCLSVLLTRLLFLSFPQSHSLSTNLPLFDMFLFCRHLTFVFTFFYSNICPFLSMIRPSFIPPPYLPSPYPHLTFPLYIYSFLIRPSFIPHPCLSYPYLTFPLYFYSFLIRPSFIPIPCPPHPNLTSPCISVLF